VSTRVGVLALQGDVREHVSALASAGAEAVAVRRPSELEFVDALILPGGESTVIARLLRLFDLMEPLRARIAAGLPVLGTCAGMILLADTIADPTVDSSGTPQESVGGIDVVVERNAFGRQVDSFETTLAVTGLDETPTSVDAVFIRAPRVVSAGAQVEVLASVGEYPVAVRQGNLLATSFHPESAGVTDFHRWLVQQAAHVSASAA
jgi:5'-phosphate synthase pdxT subunit